MAKCYSRGLMWLMGHYYGDHNDGLCHICSESRNGLTWQVSFRCATFWVFRIFASELEWNFGASSQLGQFANSQMSGGAERLVDLANLKPELKF